MPKARFAGLAAAMLCLTLAAGACAATHVPGAAGHAKPRATTAPGSTATPGVDMKALAADYLAIARPANHRLDVEVDGYTDQARHDLAAAKSDLRAQAATERGFDHLLLNIPFPPAIAATARALVRANQSRVELTLQQAQASSITSLLSFTSGHKAADAAVEAQVRIIRQDLGLPPPETS